MLTVGWLFPFALLLTCLNHALLVKSSSDVLVPEPFASCVQLSQVCLDHGNVVVYSDDANTLPKFNVSDMESNWVHKDGNGDRFDKGTDAKFRSPLIRRATDWEACEDLAHPAFQNLTALVIWPWYPHNMHEFFRHTFTPLQRVYGDQWLAKDAVLLASSPGGLPVPGFSLTLLQTLSLRPVLQLDRVASRQGVRCEGEEDELHQQEYEDDDGVFGSLGVRAQRGAAAGGDAGASDAPAAAQAAVAAVAAGAPGSEGDVGASKGIRAGRLRGAAAGSALGTGKGRGRRRARKGVAQGSDRPGGSSTRKLLQHQAGSQQRMGRLLVEEQAEEASSERSGRCFARAVLCKTWVKESPTPIGTYTAAGQYVQQYYRDDKQVPPSLATWSRGSSGLEDETGGADAAAAGGQQEPAAATAAAGAAEGAQSMDKPQQRSGPSSNSNSGPGHQNGVMRVLFAKRLGNPGSRTLINQQELVAECSRWRPSAVAFPDVNITAAGDATSAGTATTASTARAASSSDDNASAASGSPPLTYTSAVCAEHTFGQSSAADLAVLSATDLLVAVHGAVCSQVFMARPFTSLLELRPFNFDASWSNGMAHLMCELDMRQLWWGVDSYNASHYKPSDTTGSWLSSLFTEERDRHMWLPWSAIQHKMDLIARVGRDPRLYRAVHLTGLHYTNELNEPLPYDMKWVGLPEGRGWRGNATEEEWMLQPQRQ